ncbi:hypothetical protein [Herpetosiphon gulosus]|uniref:hypothetical protein n=1 Tax=Herpetosiphon gulosus TaxID=1973496 RepID=UPI0031EDEC80
MLNCGGHRQACPGGGTTANGGRAADQRRRRLWETAQWSASQVVLAMWTILVSTAHLAQDN